MARRIQLPGADELFGGAPKKPSPTTPARKPASAKKASPKKNSSSPNVAKTAAKTSQTAARRTSSVAKRGTRDSKVSDIDAIESRLATLPIDSLMDLRDGLEDILAADTLDEEAVRELLDSFGA